MSPVEPEIKKDDRVIWNDRIGTVMEIDTSAQKTAVGRRYGWPFAAWVLFDDKEDRDAWTCVNAFYCRKIPKAEP